MRASIVIPKQAIGIAEKKVNKSVVISPFEKIILKVRIIATMITIANKITKNPLIAIQLIRLYYDKFKKTFGNTMLTKAVKSEGKYYWRFSTPAFPSQAWNSLIYNELRRFVAGEKITAIRTLLFAITKKCPLNCEHCFEWPNINKEDVLSADDISDIVEKYQAVGSSQIMFSGGEPMLRFNDILSALNKADSGTDFWVVTSGLGLDRSRAEKLKNAGLRSVMISLDHYDEAEHNKFRGSENSYEDAINAIQHACDSGLAVTMSLCATKSFIDGNHFPKYMELARELGVVFVQVLDPRESGRYVGKDVELKKHHIEQLEEYYLDYNAKDEYSDYPIVNYLGYHSRRTGCFGAGNRFFYIDTDGDAHPCPFCTNKVCSVKDNSVEEVSMKLESSSCFSYEKSEI